MSAPSWLTPSNDAPAPSPAANLEVDSAPHTNLSSNMNNGGSTSPSSDADEKDLPGIILTMRLANMGVAAATITVSVSLS